MKKVILEYTSTVVGYIGVVGFFCVIGTLFWSKTGLVATLIRTVIGGV